MRKAFSDFQFARELIDRVVPQDSLQLLTGDRRVRTSAHSAYEDVTQPLFLEHLAESLQATSVGEQSLQHAHQLAAVATGLPRNRADH